MATGRCRGNQSGSHPARVEPSVALGNWMRWFPRSPSPTSDSGLGEAQGKGKSQRDSCGDLGPWGRPFRKELTRSWNAPPSCSLRRGEAETTTPKMPRGGWPILVRSLAQSIDGNCSSLLLEGLNDCMGWAWGARALGCLRRNDRRTLLPCFPSPQPRGLQRLTRLQTQVASAKALVS